LSPLEASERPLVAWVWAISFQSPDDNGWLAGAKGGFVHSVKRIDEGRSETSALDATASASFASADS
jgi:hypothetical protein